MKEARIPLSFVFFQLNKSTARHRVRGSFFFFYSRFAYAAIEIKGKNEPLT